MNYHIDNINKNIRIKKCLYKFITMDYHGLSDIGNCLRLSIFPPISGGFDWLSIL